MKQLGKLYLIPTSLSNRPLVDELKSSDIEIVEKLSHFIVETPKTARAYLKGMDIVLQQLDMQILDEHSHLSDISSLLEPLMNGFDIGLMSDAGCPGVADPGSLVVRECHRREIEIVPMVGPSSILLSLMASGLNGQNFAFQGYLPRDPQKRKDRIKQLERLSFNQFQTQIFIEAPYRNKQLLKDILEMCSPATQLCIATDITGKKNFLRTLTVKEWRDCKHDIEDIPTVFLLLAGK